MVATAGRATSGISTSPRTPPRRRSPSPERWPRDGMPDESRRLARPRPRATARSTGIRRERCSRAKTRLQEVPQPMLSEPEPTVRRTQDYGCPAHLHALPPRARAGRRRWRSRCASLGGLTTAEIARAFLVPRDRPCRGGSTRAKRRSATPGSRSPCPPVHRSPTASPRCSPSSTSSSTRATRPRRATRSGTTWRRGDPARPRCSRAPARRARGRRAARAHAAARRAACRARPRDGELVLLADQDRSRWDGAADRRRPARC